MTDKTTADPYEAILGVPRPDWAAWKTKTHAPLWAAAALACDIDPHRIELDGQRFLAALHGYPAPMKELLAMAKSAVAAGGMLRLREIPSANFEGAEVSLANFAAWLASIKYPVPNEFPWAPEAPDFAQLHWPWGRHSTTLLRKLAEVADKLWKNYDPDDPTTAPTNETVTAWLIEHGVSKRNAEVMATLLRADGLPPGPRK